MRAAPVLGVLIAAAALAGASPARRPPSDSALILEGLTRAVEAGRLDPAEAGAYRALVGRAGALMGRLPKGRAVELRGVLHDVAVQRGAYTRPRALTLFSTLELNEDQLAAHPLPAPRTDVQDADGVVYRYFPGHGFVFHPLAEFAALNAAVSTGDEEVVSTLAQALLSRAVPAPGGALAWEYEFPFSGGRPPWTSGMAQAVAAQSLARAGDLLSDGSLLNAADAAYAAVPGRLVRELTAGPWIRLYSFTRAPVLNAQLQTIVSLDDYAEITGDERAAAMVQRLKAAAEALLPRFDTGYWSLYSLAGDESTRSYHEYVVSLLRTLSNRFDEPIWKESADRFAGYETEPPVVKPGRPVPALYPLPADGYRDVARFRFWLSKRSHVTLQVAGESIRLELGHGPQVLTWRPGSTTGLFHPLLRAVDQNGHVVVVALSPLVVTHDLGPLELEVEVGAPATVSWTSTDEGTPWLALAVHLDAGPKHRVLKLGRRGRSGTAALRLPPGRWHARLVAVNSAGRLRSVSLGYLPR